MIFIKETENRNPGISVRMVRNLTILLSCLLCLMGVGILIDPGICTGTSGIFWGILFILLGIVRWTGYRSQDLFCLAFQFDFEFGIILIVAGVMILLKPQIMLNYGGPALEILILTDALFRIRICKQAKSFGIETWWLALALAVMTAVVSSMAILITILHSKMMIRALGMSMLVEGCLNFCIVKTMVSTIQTKDYKQKERWME